MIYQNVIAIRAALQASDDGMSVKEIVAASGIHPNVARDCLKRMGEAYIDRWRYTGSRPEAVWCLANVPADCPKPDRKWRAKGKQ